MLVFLRARAVPGVEIVDGGRYLRTVEVDGAMGSIEVTHLPDRQSLGVSIRFPDVRLLPAIVARVRRQFDLGADIETIDGHLSGDPVLAPLVAQRPGLRAPGGWDGFEIAVKGCLGPANHRRRCAWIGWPAGRAPRPRCAKVLTDPPVSLSCVPDSETTGLGCHYWTGHARRAFGGIESSR